MWKSANTSENAILCKMQHTKLTRIEQTTSTEHNKSRKKTVTNEPSCELAVIDDVGDDFDIDELLSEEI